MIMMMMMMMMVMMVMMTQLLGTQFASRTDYGDEYDDIIAEQNLLKFFSWVITFLHRRPFGAIWPLLKNALLALQVHQAFHLSKAF